MRHSVAGIVIAILAASFNATASAPPGGEEPESVGSPDLRIIGWTIDDSLAGNADGGLHPGETAYLQVHLSNQGNATARSVAGTLSEAVDHPDVEIIDKFALWPDLPATGTPGTVLFPHFRIQVAPSRPCAWEIPLKLELIAEGGYFTTLEFTVVMVDPDTIDLAPGAARPVLFGADSGDLAGIAVAGGDFDGDGFEDLAIGVYGGDGPAELRAYAGEVTVLYGGPERTPDLDLAFPPAASSIIYGAGILDLFGEHLVTGDLDGDGFDDLIASAREGDGPSDGRAGAGEAVVIYGSPARLPATIDLSVTPFPVDIAFVYGADVDDSLGEGLGAADLNDDGLDELIVGAPRADGPGNTISEAGEVVVIYGDPTRLYQIDLSAVSTYPPVATIYGPGGGDRLGASIAGGDIDGDGFDDLILSATDGDGPGNGRSNAGEVAVIYGGPDRLVDIDLATPPSGVAWIYGASDHSFFGQSTATGDLDCDGFLDLILGGTGEGAAGPDGTRAVSFAGAGESAVIYGGPVRLTSIDLAAPPTGVTFIYGRGNDDRLGAGIAAGDLDGDGCDELILGAPDADGPLGSRSQAGGVAVIHGRPGRLTDIDLAAPPADVLLIHGATVDDELGQSVGVADVDGDGLDDLIAGAIGADGPLDTRADAGDVVVIPGEPRTRYRYDVESFAFIDATVGTDLGLACDDCSTDLPIGFGLNYFGRTHDSVTVSSNGYLTFDGPGQLPAGFCPPASTPPNDTIAVLWDDWNPAAGGAVYALLQGTAPNRRLTIEWAGVPLYPAAGDATFEVTLFESSDQILMQYQDTLVAGPPSDSGGTAVVGLENRPGRYGVAASCFSPAVVDGAALRYRRFASPTTIFSDDVESGTNGWTSGGLWHIAAEPSACSPVSRSGNASWYFGQDAGCVYDTGSAEVGMLQSSAIPSLPQDAALSFWQRREVEPDADKFVVDRSFVRASGNGGPFSELEEILESTGYWRYSGDVLDADPLAGSFVELDLSSFVGQDLAIQFAFDTVDDQFNDYLGWMIDDIEVRACPVFATGGAAAAAAEARATAQPSAVCETDTGMVDAIGSWCASCSTALNYQWREEGVAIPGATGVSYTIPAGHALGTYDYTVAIDCPTSPACADQSDPAAVAVVQQPVEVGATLMVDLDTAGTGLLFHWTDVAGAADYVLYSGTDPAATFTDEVGSSASGSTGIAAPIPPGSLILYRVAGRNPVCGVGPQR